MPLSNKLNVGWMIAVMSAATRCPAAVLATESFQISNSGGLPNGSGTSDMIINTAPPTSFSGGAVAVQGTSATRIGGGSAPAANVAFKFSVGATVDTLNAAYGAGNWTIANPKLTLQYTLYANNPRFGSGAGTLDIYWVGNDNWSQGTIDPAYATIPATLRSWAGSQADLATVNYAWTTNPASPTGPSWVTDKSLPAVSFNLTGNPLLAADVTSATTASNANVSLYLMATSSTVGMTIFTGGGNVLPTLSFDVVSTPEPASLLLAAAAMSLLRRRRQA